MASSVLLPRTSIIMGTFCCSRLSAMLEFRIVKTEIGLPNWPPVSVSLIESLINRLKINKAPGGDYIPVEMLMDFKEKWLPLLAKLFTLTRKFFRNNASYLGGGESVISVY